LIHIKFPITRPFRFWSPNSVFGLWGLILTIFFIYIKFLINVSHGHTDFGPKIHVCALKVLSLLNFVRIFWVISRWLSLQLKSPRWFVALSLSLCGTCQTPKYLFHYVGQFYLIRKDKFASTSWIHHDEYSALIEAQPSIHQILYLFLFL
jgi:hypothetical protein